MEYHLIVELEAVENEEFNQLIIVNGRCVRNIPTVNPNTCYTGKKIIVDINGEIRSANICMISDDLDFISEHFRVIEVERAAAIEARQRRDTLSHKSDANGVCHQRSPDSNLPEPAGSQKVPPMTFDQQTQTDRRLYDRMFPASAAQMAQQMDGMAQIQSQNNAILGTINEIYRNMVTISNRCNQLSNTDEEILRRMRVLEESFEQFKRGQGFNSPPENSIYLQLTPDGSSPSENLLIDANDVQIEPVEQKPTVKTYKAQSSRKSKSPLSENDENQTPNVKRMKVLSPNESAECNSSQLVYHPEEDIIIGPNGTKVPAHVLKTVNWACYSVATRRILVAVFNRNVLATHSLSGKPSPAFLDRDAKKQLDPRKIQDIVQYVSQNANVPESNVRCIITAKCADENKMYKSGIDSASGSSDKNNRKSITGNSSTSK